MPHSRAICAVLQAAESAGVGTLCVLKLVAPQQMERIAFLVALLAFEGFGARIFTEEPAAKRKKRHQKYAREFKEAKVIKERLKRRQQENSK